MYGFDIQNDNVEICIQNVLALCGQYFHVTKATAAEIRQRYILADSLKVLPLLARYGEGNMLMYVREAGNEKRTQS